MSTQNTLLWDNLTTKNMAYLLLVRSLGVLGWVGSPGGISGCVLQEDHCPHSWKTPTGLRIDIKKRHYQNLNRLVQTTLHSLSTHVRVSSSPTKSPW